MLSFGVWAHHMFATGMDPRLRASFMVISLAIAVPSAVKTFNWMTTMWNGNVRLTTPMLFCIGFVSNFIIGGVTGVFLASIPVDMILHDTYYVVGHFHYIVMGAITFAGFAGIYYWFPIYTGRMYQRTLGKAHFWLSMIGTNVTFFAMIALGYVGMPRRYATYQFDGAIAPLTQVSTIHQAATLGAHPVLGQLIFVWNLSSPGSKARKSRTATRGTSKATASRPRVAVVRRATRRRGPEEDPSRLATAAKKNKTTRKRPEPCFRPLLFVRSQNGQCQELRRDESSRREHLDGAEQDEKQELRRRHSDVRRGSEKG